jgi:isopenicillin-N N-acyltransferase like protein
VNVGYYSAAMPDLMIGGRRSAAPRSWRAAVIAIGLLGVAVVVTWFIYRRSVAYELPGGEVRGEIALTQADPGAPTALVFGTSSLSWTGGIPVLRVVGDAHAIGAAHGRLLAPWLAPAIRAAAPSIEGTVDRGGWFGGSTHGMRVAWRWRFIDDGLLDPDRRMVAGMTRGAEASGALLSFEELVRGQAVLDVGEPSPRTAEADDHRIARSLTIFARSAPASATAPARLWIGRAFALPGLDDGGDAAFPVVTIAHPEGRLSWAGVGWPGALGVVTGVNANGIAVMVNPVRTADVRVTRTARPVAHLARAVLEQAKTLDEAVKLIEITPTLGAAVIALADSAGTWLLVERTPTKAIVERSPRAAVLGDVLTTNALAGDPENDRARRMLTTASRLERAGRLVRGPLSDAGAMASVLRDQRTPDDAVRPAGHRGVIDDGRAAHVAILDPGALALWVGDPRAGGRMRGFDLRYELRREGERPAPPPDIAADPAADPDRAAILAGARADLRAARAALRAGELERADEACARARARAPQLPEALELDAFIAQARGDHARARAAFQAWIDAGPDKPKSEERARALLAR